MPKLSIRVRLALAHTILLGIILSLWSAGLYHVAKGRLLAQVDAELEERFAAVRLPLSVGNGRVNWLVDRRAVEESSYIAHAIYDGSGLLLERSQLADIFALPVTDAARRAVEERRPQWETLELAYGHTVRVLNSPITGSDGAPYLLRVSRLLDQAEDDLRLLVTLLALFLPLILLAGGLAGWWMAGRALAPVAEITAAANRITARHLAERLPLRGTGDELDQLSHTLNDMMARLQSSFERMSQFLSNVSHELRTPLAALRGSCDVALRTARSEAEYREALSSNIEDLERLSHTVFNLLALARAEAGQVPLHCRPEDLGELLRDAVESTRPLASERGVSIECAAKQDVYAAVDAEHILRLLVNLLDNAIKYNQPGGQVRAEVGARDSWAVLTVADTGQGISPEDLPHIFDRFYRGEKEHGSASRGAGLGLSLVHWIAHAHGGRIEVQSELGRGSTFRVWLPVTRPDTSEG